MKIVRMLVLGVVGLLFGIFVGLDLILFGIVALNSAAVTVAAAFGLFGGVAIGWRRSARV